MVTGLVQYVPTVLPLLVEGGITLFTGLLDSLNQIVELLMPQLPEIVKKNLGNACGKPTYNNRGRNATAYRFD